MTSRDAVDAGSGSGGAGERIPQGAEPGDVIFGKPSDVDDLVIKLRAYAGAFKDGRAQLDVLMFKRWTGAASEEFDAATKKLPKELDAAHTYFSAAANALDAYADQLRSVHRRVKPVIEDADEARATSKRYWKRVKAYNAALERGDDPLPERPPESDPGVAAMDSCYRRLDTLEAELQAVVDPAKRKLEKAAKKAPKGPGPRELKRPEGSDRNSLQEALKGLADWYGERDDEVQFWKEHGLVDGSRMELAGLRDGAAYAIDNPKEFAKAVTDWEEWQRNPSRAFGKLTPELLLALATRGMSGPLSAARRFRTATQRLSGRESVLRRDGSARERTDSEPGKNDKRQGDRQRTGEPIDVATGEMVMSATDIALPGDLPLVLERHYVSGHPCGGWFGATWAATLDQRLELDEAGIVYVADDGMLLTYPIPEPEVPVLPTSGPRWPLLWDGKPDGAMTVTLPEQNRTLHFAPLPVHGRELALRAITDRTGEGDRVTFTYDAEGTPVEIAHSGGYRLTVDTDKALHRVTALRLLHGEHHEHSTPLVSYAYDAAGNLTEIINSTGEPLRYRYDDQHRVTSWTDRNGTSFAYVYDHRGRVLRTIGPDGMMSGRLHHDPAARTTRYTDSLGHTTTYVYNEAYKVTAITDPLGHTTRTEWDETNRHPVTTTDPLGRTTRCTYDEDAHLTAVEHPDGTVTEATYDAWGLPLSVREPGGGVWRHTYDERGARTSTTDPAGARTTYTYDPAGHLSSLTDPLGHTTSVTTDGAGLPVSVTDPLGHTTHVRRGPHGRITSLTDPLGHTTRQGWTVEGKPAWREHPDGTRESWEWDGEGNLLTHTDQAGHRTEHTHTHFDLPATRTDPDGARYAFTYDTELRLVGVTNPQGREWRYDFDAAGRLVAETDFNGARRTYELDAAGGLLARTNACGETLRYELDARGRVLRQRSEADGEETTYAYDANGSLIHTANAAASVALERDPVVRVLTETVNGRTVSYAYDAAGNRTSRTTPLRPHLHLDVRRGGPPGGHGDGGRHPLLHVRRGRPRNRPPPGRTRHPHPALGRGGPPHGAAHPGPRRGDPPAPLLHLPPRRLRHRNPRTHRGIPPLRYGPDGPRHLRPGPRLDGEVRLRPGGQPGGGASPRSPGARRPRTLRHPHPPRGPHPLRTRRLRPPHPQDPPPPERPDPGVDLHLDPRRPPYAGADAAGRGVDVRIRPVRPPHIEVGPRRPRTDLHLGHHPPHRTGRGRRHHPHLGLHPGHPPPGSPDNPRPPTENPPVPRDRHGPNRHPHRTDIPRRRVVLATPHHPLGHPPPHPTHHHRLPPPLPRPIHRPRNRPPLQLLPPLRPRNRPVPDAGPVGVGSGAQPPHVRWEPAHLDGPPRPPGMQRHRRRHVRRSRPAIRKPRGGWRGSRRPADERRFTQRPGPLPLGHRIKCAKACRILVVSRRKDDTHRHKDGGTGHL